MVGILKKFCESQKSGWKFSKYQFLEILNMIEIFFNGRKFEKMARILQNVEKFSNMVGKNGGNYANFKNLKKGRNFQFVGISNTVVHFLKMWGL
jgi:hypothetical protein